MIYYAGLIIFIIVIRAVTQEFAKKEPLKWCYIFSAAAVILFQGLRSFNVGVDLVGYVPAYTMIGKKVDFSWDALTSVYNYEIGYVLLNKIIYLLGFDSRGFLFVVAAIIQIPIFKTMYKHSDNPLLSILAYFAFGNFIMTFSGLRQGIAMAICFYAYTSIKEKKGKKFIFQIILAWLFHQSSIICLALYPLYYCKIKRSQLPLILIALAVCFLLRSRIVAFANKLYYEETGEETRTGAYTMFVVYLALYVLSFLRERPDEDYRGLQNILLLLVFIYSLSSVSNTIIRIGFPLTLYLTIFIPKVIKVFKVEKESKVVYNGACCLLCIVYFFTIVGGLNTLPFSFL